MEDYRDFLESAATEDNPFMPTADFPRWLEERRGAHAFEIQRIEFAEMGSWLFEPATGNLQHVTGRFFKIEGVWVETNYGDVASWSQPIISQPEVGILGIITKKFGNILYFLMQAKMEPGNINTVQLAPTLQATRSNFARVHGGKAPPYLEYFLDRPGVRTLVDVLQSEQGARFYRKRNRNIIIEVEEDILLLADFCWLTLRQIQELVLQDNIVNMDARTVLGCIRFSAYNQETRTNRTDLGLLGARRGKASTTPHPDSSRFRDEVFDSLLDTSNARNSMEQVLSWFTRLKFRYELVVEPMPLKYVRNWTRTKDAIVHNDGKYFSVIAVRVQANNREVPCWTQPLVKPREEGIVAFVTRRFNGILHFLIQAKVEPGNFDVVEMAPTVQCLTGSYRDVSAERCPPFLNYVLHAPAELTRLSTMQSEEGGRFYQETNRNLIVEADASIDDELPPEYIWMTLNQLKVFIQFNNFINVQARCLLAGLLM